MAATKYQPDSHMQYVVMYRTCGVVTSAVEIDAMFYVYCSSAPCLLAGEATESG